MGYPEEFIKKISEKIERKWILAFLTAFIFGLLVHFYRLANFLITWDSVYNFHASQNKPELGRIFLSVACGISSFYDIQWISGLLSIIYLSLITVLMVIFFALEKKLTIVLTAMMVMSFPVVASTFAYMYTADGYFLGMLLFTLAVVITAKDKKGWIAAAILVALAYGTYQAYIAYAIMLILVWSILQLTRCCLRRGELLGYWLRFAGMGAIGTLLYLIAFKLLVFLQHTEVSTYNGVSGMGIPNSIEKWIQAIKNCVIDFGYFFFGPLHKLSLYQIVNVVWWILLAVLILHILIRQVREGRAKEALGIFFCVAAMPFACSVIYFVSPDVRYYMLMDGGFLFVYLLPILWYDRVRCDKRLAWWIVLTTKLTIIVFVLISNVAYLYMHTSNEKTMYLVNRMVDRIEQLPGYTQAKKLCVIGHFADYDTIEYAVPPAMAGIRDSYLISEQAHFVAVMRDHFGLDLDNASEEERAKIMNLAEFKEMGKWPADNSVIMDGDTIIMKIDDK